MGWAPIRGWDGLSRVELTGVRDPAERVLTDSSWWKLSRTRFTNTFPCKSSILLLWGIHLTQVASRRCGLVDPQTPSRCTQNAPRGARRRPEGDWAMRLRFGPIKDHARAMAITGLEAWCYRQASPGAANAQPQYLVVT